MDEFERLAALLADELDTDERTALERELARDGALRAQLDAMRRADAALASLDPPAPPEGFEERIDAAIDAELRALLGPATDHLTDGAARGSDGAVGGSDGAVGGRDGIVLGSGDAFTARRRRRENGRMRALVGVAAGVAVLAVGGVVVSQLGLPGADDSGDSVAMDAEAGADDTAALGLAPDGQPVLVDDGRDLDDAGLDVLLSSPELDELRAERMDADTGRQLATVYQSALGITGAPGAEMGALADEAPADDGATESDAPEAAGEAEEEATESDDADADVSDADDMATTDEDRAPPELFGRDGQALPPEAAGDITRCLSVLLDAEGNAIPVYAELATYEGTDAIVYGLVTLDPTTERFSRTEVWALDRATCQVLRFSQG